MSAPIRQGGIDEIIRRAAERWKSSPDDYILSGYDGRVAMLKVYGDDSFGRNEPGAQGCCVIAGYLTESETWKEITKEWRAVLNEPPKINYFRMREYVDRDLGREERGQFQGLSKIDAAKKLDSLVSVLEKYGKHLAWMDSIITWDAFNYSLGPIWSDFFKDPHYFGVMGIMEGCRNTLHKLGGEQPVDFVFDMQVGLDVAILQGWKSIKNSLPEDQTTFMHQISFADDKNLLPLQCADLLAWHVRRNYINLPEDHRRPRPEYKRLRKSVGIYSSITWKEEGLKEEVHVFAERLAEQARQRKHKKKG
jgi:hypothetical protein